jgi:riboflavin biosynthesis pyrimidine reductase
MSRFDCLLLDAATVSEVLTCYLTIDTLKIRTLVLLDPHDELPVEELILLQAEFTKRTERPLPNILVLRDNSSGVAQVLPPSVKGIKNLCFSEGATGSDSERYRTLFSHLYESGARSLCAYLGKAQTYSLLSSHRVNRLVVTRSPKSAGIGNVMQEDALLPALSDDMLSAIRALPLELLRVQRLGDYSISVYDRLPPKA